MLLCQQESKKVVDNKICRACGKEFKQIMTNRDRHSQQFHAENNHDILQKMKSQLSDLQI